MKVLIIDDDDDVRTIARLSLARLGGMTVNEASSGAEGLKKAEAECPDVILLDVMMAGMDGAATLAALRERPATAAIPVVFLTAKVMRSEIERLRGLGAIGVLIKPFNPKTLGDEVRDLLRRNDPSG